MSPGRNVQLIPYGTFTGARFLDDTRFDTKADGRVGMDAKIIAHDSVAIDLTANPDFSQVESDEPQVTINQRFEVFFPEKRPFFLENAGYFQTPINLFFSRRIGDPQVGVRATGKLGGWAAGALAIDDRAPGRARRRRRSALRRPVDQRRGAGAARDGGVERRRPDHQPRLRPARRTASPRSTAASSSAHGSSRTARRS